MLGDQLLKTFNIVCKFVSLSLFHSRYKSCESNVNGHRGSHVLAFSKAKRCLAPPRIKYFFRHCAPVLDHHQNVQMVPHTFAMVEWYKPARNPLPSFQPAQESIDMLCAMDFELPSANSIIPVLHIHSPIAIINDYIDNMNAFVKMP
ncbi:hypothetical protein V8B55DRAFT_1414368 [Mucor lusitanicus]